MTRSRKTLIVSVTAALSLVAGGARPAPTQGLDPAVLRGADAPPNALWLEPLDFSAMTSGWGTPLAGKTVHENPLLLARVLDPRGIGTHSASEWAADLHGEAVRFLSYVGVLDEVACGEGAAASIRHVVKADGTLTLDLLTNDEILAVSQDSLGKQGRRAKADAEGREVWVRELGDGTLAVALFNRGAEASRVEVRFAEGWGATVPRHGALLLKVGVPKGQE